MGYVVTCQPELCVCLGLAIAELYINCQGGKQRDYSLEGCHTNSGSRYGCSVQSPHHPSLTLPLSAVIDI